MNNAMKYKGYLARIDYDDDDAIFVGHISGIRDIVVFHGESVAQLRTAFEEAVDNYLDACEQLGQKPDKPSNGKILLRVDPEIHRAAIVAAEMHGKSLNQWATEVLKTASLPVSV
ncbi:MAG TPA: toxin-antitoxin system HicB family antitoxin [Methylococcaceae bacterium]|nr:toxin-antitoxin system HicB family antitoxin [Methylococcaceae bacterium]